MSSWKGSVAQEQAASRPSVKKTKSLGKLTVFTENEKELDPLSKEILQLVFAGLDIKEKDADRFLTLITRAAPKENPVKAYDEALRQIEYKTSLYRQDKAATIIQRTVRGYQARQFVASLRLMEKNKVFGIPLVEQIETDKKNGNNLDCPFVLSFLMTQIEDRADTEGLFRIAGSREHVHGLQEMFDQKPPNDWRVNEENAHALTSLFRSYFQLLPEPVIGTEFLQIYTREVMDEYSDPSDRAALEIVGKALVKYLTPQIWLFLKEIGRFLRSLTAHAKRSKMTADNLALILGPALCRPDEREHFDASSALVLSLISDYLYIFDEERRDEWLKQIKKSSHMLDRELVQRPASPTKEGVLASALWDFEAEQPGDLPFKKGATIQVTRMEGGWWDGKIGKMTGRFPSNYVQLNETSPTPEHEQKGRLMLDIEKRDHKSKLRSPTLRRKKKKN